MRRPLVIVAFLYGCGLLLADFITAPVPVLFTCALASVALALLIPRWRTPLLCSLLVLAGWTNLTWRTVPLSPHDLRAILSEPEDVILRAALLETPAARPYLANGVERWRTLTTAHVESICRNGVWEPAAGDVVIRMPGTLPPEFFVGQRVEVSGVIAPPDRAAAPGLFDYRQYLARLGIHFELRTSGPEEWRLVSERRVPPLSDRFLAWARNTLARGLPEGDTALRLLWAMVLGSKNVLANEVYDPFIQTGTMHIFAISGMHIALLAGILVSLLRVVRVPRFWCGAVVIPLIWFYTGATGWQPSAVRSALMMTVVVGGWSLKRPGDLLNSLGAAAVAILLFDPHQLFQASFQLSFFVVLSIALLVPPLRRFVDRLLRFDPLLPAELVPRWKRLLVSPVRWLLMFTATSVAAWLGAWPLTALYFHMFSPVTLLANLAMVPLSSAALACSLGSLVFGAWCPPVSELFNHSAWFWMTLAMRGSEILAHIPGAFFYVPAPALVDFVLYYCVLIACLSGFAFAPRRRYWTAALLVGIGAFYFWRWNDARHGTVLTVLPVSGGSAVHCDAPGWRDDLLLDCGNTNSVKFVTLPFLRSRGVNCLASMALSHGDTKCVGGAIALLDEVPARQTAISPVRFRSAVYRRVAAELPKHADHHREIHRGEQLNRWSVLHPERTAKASQADDAALVLMGDHHGARVLLLSDLSRAGQNALIDSGQDLRADIVIAGLPEKSEPLCDALIERVGPRLIIIADSEFPATRRASPALRDRLARASIPVLYTRFAGAVTLELRANRIRVTAMDGTRMEFARD